MLELWELQGDGSGNTELFLWTLTWCFNIFYTERQNYAVYLLANTTK